MASVKTLEAQKSRLTLCRRTCGEHHAGPAWPQGPVSSAASGSRREKRYRSFCQAVSRAIPHAAKLHSFGQAV
uniref:Uncharacterized protein n=1 Tax=Sphaerodactylus townsendi TaxID=933632 RepID=A0ACB8E615_9SAUR